MSWQRVADFSARQDLAALHTWLANREFPHRFSIEGDKQVLWTPRADLVEPLNSLIKEFESGAVIPEVEKSRATATRQLPQIHSPMTLLLLLLSFAGSAIFSLGNEMIQMLTFYDLSPFYRNRSEFSAIFEGQFWRLFTPIFLHFGFLHIAFNAMWLWYLGSRLEQVFGSFQLLLIVLFIALASNIAQAVVSYPIPFGGMSGVVFGLLGFFWVASKLEPHPQLFMPAALFPIMLILMLISVFGAFDWMAGAEVADTAHVSGLVCGLIAGLAHKILLGRSGEN